MKNCLRSIIFVSGVSSTFAAEYRCPDTFEARIEQTGVQDFQVFPVAESYNLSSAILYSGHPEGKAALKGLTAVREKNGKAFWLVCGYKFNEASAFQLQSPQLIKEIPDSFTSCEFSQDQKGVTCE